METKSFRYCFLTSGHISLVCSRGTNKYEHLFLYIQCFLAIFGFGMLQWHFQLNVKVKLCDYRPDLIWALFFPFVFFFVSKMTITSISMYSTILFFFSSSSEESNEMKKCLEIINKNVLRFTHRIKKKKPVLNSLYKNHSLLYKLFKLSSYRPDFTVLEPTFLSRAPSEAS